MKNKEWKKKIINQVKPLFAPDPVVIPYSIVSEGVKKKLRKDLLTFVVITIGCFVMRRTGGAMFTLLGVASLFAGLFAAWDTYYNATRNKLTEVDAVITSVHRAGYRKQYTEVRLQDLNDVCYCVTLYSKTKLTIGNEVTLYLRQQDPMTFSEGEYLITKPFLLERKSARIVNTKDES